MKHRMSLEEYNRRIKAMETYMSKTLTEHDVACKELVYQQACRMTAYHEEQIKKLTSINDYLLILLAVAGVILGAIIF